MHKIQSMKRLILFCCTAMLVQVLPLAAQNLTQNSSVASQVSLKNSLEDILKDYPNAFRNVMGELQFDDPQFSEFASRKHLSGALSSHFLRFNTPNGNVVTYEALMFLSEDFKAASSRYKAIAQELKKGIIKMGSHRPYIIDGKYQTPTDDLKFNEVIYTLLPADRVVDKLKIVISLEYVFPEWQVNIKLYDKEKDTSEVHGDEDDDL